MQYFKVADIRKEFKDLKSREEYVIDKSGVKLLEIIDRKSTRLNSSH